MTNSKLALAVGLAAAALALVLPNLAGGIAVVLGLATGTALNISSIVLATAAFGVSWKQRSFLVAALLAVTGIIYMSPGLIALASINFAVIIVPGPILGVIFGLAIFGLGAAKGIGTAKTAIVTAR